MNAEKPVKSFEHAVERLNDGASAAAIYKALIKVPKFKVALEVAGLTQLYDNTAEVLAPNGLSNNSVQ